jgi:hypothetical protein
MVLIKKAQVQFEWLLVILGVGFVLLVVANSFATSFSGIANIAKNYFKNGREGGGEHFASSSVATSSSADLEATGEKSEIRLVPRKLEGRLYAYMDQNHNGYLNIKKTSRFLKIGY